LISHMMRLIIRAVKDIIVPVCQTVAEDGLVVGI
jgi:hypothetical protein